MGTRHQQKVINKNGEVKISQYGQWDGYPSGQGVQILEFLKSSHFNWRFEENLNKLRQLTIKEIEMLESLSQDDFNKKYHYLSRDCGSKIYYLVAFGLVDAVDLTTDEQANKWCEGFYTIDLQKNVFISEFYDKKTSYSLDKLPTIAKYLKDMKSED